MSSIPRTDSGAVQFFTSHAAQWADHAAEVGLMQAEADQALELAKAAAEAHARAIAARIEAETATAAMNAAIAAMRSVGGRAIAKIRAHAAMVDDPHVFVVAQLEAGLDAAGAAPAAQPRIIGAELQALGAVKLRWRVHHTLETRAEGTQYMVMRMIPGVAGEERWRMLEGGLIGGRGRKGHEFTDDTLPPAAVLGRGHGEVRYMIVPRRAGLQGPTSGAYTLVIGGMRVAPSLARAA